MILKVLKTASDQWLRHRSARLGAALAYYSVFSMGPLLLIVTGVAGLFFGAEAARGSLTAQFRSLLGETGSKAVEAMLAGASSEQSGRLAAITGLILLLVAALGVVVQLKDAAVSLVVSAGLGCRNMDGGIRFALGRVAATSAATPECLTRAFREEPLRLARPLSAEHLLAILTRLLAAAPALERPLLAP